jgi:hypothetical protein
MKNGTKTIAIFALAVLFSASATAQIQDRVQIHGLGGWAMGRTDNANVYGSIAGKQTPMSNHYFTLNLSAQLERNVSIFAQPSWQTTVNGDEMVIDYVFAQWMITKQVGLRMGKIKNPIGIYSEVLNVGTLRPFYLVPQGMYVAISQAYTGAGLTGIIGLGPLEMSYDLVGGFQQYEPVVIIQPVAVDPVTSRPIYISVPADPEGRNFVGGRLLFETPVSGLKFGGTLIGFDMYYQIADGPTLKSGETRSVGYTGQAEYVTDRVQARAEYGKLDDPNLSAVRGFAEAAWKVTPHWQVAADYDWAEFNFGAIAMAGLTKDKNLDRHKAAGLALNYWVNQGLVFKLNRYWVNGNILCKPADAAQVVTQGKLKHDTDVWIFGMQFSF